MYRWNVEFNRTFSNMCCDEPIGTEVHTLTEDLDNRTNIDDINQNIHGFYKLMDEICFKITFAKINLQSNDKLNQSKSKFN